MGGTWGRVHIVDSWRCALGACVALAPAGGAGGGGVRSAASRRNPPYWEAPCGRHNWHARIKALAEGTLCKRGEKCGAGVA